MTSEQNGCFVTIGSGLAEADKPARILIVEDDFFVATDLEQTLQQEGFETVGIATTAEEAIRLAEATKPHLAIIIWTFDLRAGGTALVLQLSCRNAMEYHQSSRLLTVTILGFGSGQKR